MNGSDSTLDDVLGSSNYTLIVLYVIVFLWALVTNILVILVVIKYEYMRNVTNYFLVNLSVADLLVTLVCMPNGAYMAYSDMYYFGEYMCKASGYLQCISVASSIFTITAMAIDRYLAITRPFGFFHRCFNKTTTLVVIALLWVFSIILFLPQIWMIVYDNIPVGNNSDAIYVTLCYEKTEGHLLSKATLGVIWFIFMFVVPGVIMMFAYSMMGRTLCYVTPPCDHNEGLSSTQQGARRLQSVVPVVIRQIRDCHEDEFKMFGMPTQILHIVGILRGYEVQSTKATYNIEDHTGTIKAIWWLENDDDTTPNLPPVKEGSYLQLFGSLRNQDGEKIIMVLRMFMVDDANLITSHLLQVIQTRLQAEHMSQNSGTIKPNIQNPGTALPNSMSFMDDNNISSGLTAIQAKVQRLLQTDQSTAGMHRDVLLKNFPSNQQTEVNNAVEFLINEGHAYSTIDGDHFKSTSE